MSSELISIMLTINVLWTVGNSLAMWLRKPGSDTAAALASYRHQADTEHDQLVHRVTELEVHLEHIPTAPQIAELRSLLAAIDERTTRMGDAQRRIEDYLLHHRKG